MDNEEKRFLENAEERIERAKSDSKQPRFDKEEDIFQSVIYWLNDIENAELPYRADSRDRDKWLNIFWRKEPYLSGVINSVVSIDKNRGWSLIGGRNQVNKYSNILHNFQASNNSFGWRNGISVASQAFYTNDIGAVVEIGREGKNGPMRQLYNVDSTRCKLTSSLKYPLKYYPPKGRIINFEPMDYFRVSSMINIDENMNGLGYCALSRAAELAQIMISIYQYDKEKLGVKAPKGLLLLKGVSESQWNNSLNSRKAIGVETDYYTGVQVLASEGYEDVDAKLIALSSLPDNFDIKDFTNLLLYGYALIFGYDAREFWPVSSGTMGTASEAGTQHMKATGKGGLDFILNFQEKIQGELPDSIDFEFEQRDDAGELLEIEVKRSRSDLITSLYGSENSTEGPVISKEEARILLAESNIIPKEWTENVEDEEMTDTDDEIRVRALSSKNVINAIEKFPEEPIVIYEYPSGKTRVIFEKGKLAYRKNFRVLKNRAAETVYDNRGVTITTDDIDTAISEAGTRVSDDFAAILNAGVSE